jgi:hypothetical protein
MQWSEALNSVWRQLTHQTNNVPVKARARSQHHGFTTTPPCLVGTHASKNSQHIVTRLLRVFMQIYKCILPA